MLKGSYTKSIACGILRLTSIVAVGLFALTATACGAAPSSQQERGGQGSQGSSDTIVVGGSSESSSASGAVGDSASADGQNDRATQPTRSPQAAVAQRELVLTSNVVGAAIFIDGNRYKLIPHRRAVQQCSPTRQRKNDHCQNRWIRRADAGNRGSGEHAFRA